MASNLGLAEVSQASFNSLLAAKASKLISARLDGRKLAPQEAAVLEEAATLLDRVLEGARFVEDGRMTGHARPEQVLEEYTCALSALQTVQDLEALGEMTAVFSALHRSVVAVARGRKINNSRLETLKHFFYALSELFFSDVRRPPIRSIARLLPQP